MKIFFVSDLHGNVEILRKLAVTAITEKADAVVFGGDISRGFEIKTQRNFLQKEFLPEIKSLCEKGIKTLLIMGNDDFKINEDVIKRGENHGIIRMHMKKIKIGDFYFSGYSCINPSPFIIKDWEKEEDDIKKDLQSINPTQPEKTIYIMHAPPHNTNLDVTFYGEHVGSSSIREFIDNEQPVLTLHGHIHESHVMTGEWKQKIGKTISVNPGSCNITMINLKNPIEIERIMA